SDDSSPLSDDSDSSSPDSAGYDVDSTPSSSSSDSPDQYEGDDVGSNGLGYGGGFDGGDFGGGGSDGGDFGYGGGGGFDGGDFGGGGFDFLGNQDSPDASGSVSPDVASPSVGAASPSSSQDSMSTQVQPDAGSLSKRGFEGGLGYGGYGGYGFGGPRFRKDVNFRNAKVIRLAEIEKARRRKALEHAKVRFNTKKFNELKFKNRVHLNKDSKAKELALADRKNLDAEKIKRVGGGWW
ncbi:hypothetical protein JCM16303_006672, partial [Sporobolomyces ruberrimus]